ncbi:gamma-glutamyl hydrolase B isoform X2 [Nilaparvata lugens]|nr:gamma-glutamyl hydrolase B isoform X2 [Nilaparvata lugens]
MVVLPVVLSFEFPVIGVLTEELTASLKKVYPNYTSYIAASYVKAVEGSGARVVPLFIGQNEQYYQNKIQKLNGILFPGGSCRFDVKDGYAEAGAIIYDLVEKANLAGDHIPILGVCLGFELLMHLANGEKELRTDCRSENVGLPLQFQPGFRKSKLYSRTGVETLTTLASYPVTSNHHKYCITRKNMTETGLMANWRVLTLNKDSNNLEFVSSVESRTMPFVGIQFHPEKNSYEWGEKQHNPHSERAIKTARIFNDWLAHEARKNNHSYAKLSDLYDDLIQNYPPFFTSKKGLYFEEVYLFK